MDKKIQGRSRQFWNGFRDHVQTERRKIPVQEIQRKFETICTTRVSETRRHHCSITRRKIPNEWYKYIKTHITIYFGTHHGHDTNWRYQEIRETIFTLRQNIIKLYVLIWGQCSPAPEIKLEGDPDHTSHAPTYYCRWLFVKIKMCTSGIDHTWNWYYYIFISMRTIFCLRQGWD